MDFTSNASNEQLSQSLRVGAYSNVHHVSQNIPITINNQTTLINSSGGYLSDNINHSNDYYRQQSTTQDIMQRGPKKLKVDDALSYLDQVRQQFSQNPDIYNDFLEVMKEFKSHTIDTQGVIRRVSQLFSGHSNLITGFNTFLPPGYEVRVGAGSIIRIIEPNGESTTVNNAIDQSVKLLTEKSDNLKPQLKLDLSTINNDSNVVSNQCFLTQSVLPLREAKQVNVSNKNVVGKDLSNNEKVTQQSNNASTQKEIKDISFVLTNSNTQPLHFDQAVGYLNKIKERFANRPEIYREFLNILGNYQKISNNQLTNSLMTETEVYQAVSQLFRDEEDLMRDFKSFLPDANLECSGKQQNNLIKDKTMVSSSPKNLSNTTDKLETENSEKNDYLKLSKKRLLDNTNTNVVFKKAENVTKVSYEMSVEKCLEDIPLKDFIFFEQVQKALKCENVIKNFFRCLLLFNKNLISKYELFELTTPFLCEHPDLLKQFNEILGIDVRNIGSPNKLEKVEQRLLPELALQIDYSTCKRLGVSYRSLPESYERSVCSGRTELCHEILNDTWVSFPSWSSESTESVSSKKSVFEDFMYRTEDERFEVDILIEVNSAAINALEVVNKKIELLKLEEAQKYMIESNYGCNSPTLMARAIKKLYGEHSGKVLEGLCNNPFVAIEQVLKRLREKDVEWRSVREEFNVIWRDQTEKNYIKSLDHQAITFKTNDLKIFRTKSIIQQFETLYSERKLRIENGGKIETGPNLILDYTNDVSIISDVNELIIHHVKRQQNIPKREKFMIKKLLKIGLIPQLYDVVTTQLSDDEDESDIDKSSEDQTCSRKTRRFLEAKFCSKKFYLSQNELRLAKFSHTTLFGPNCWIIFFRLHNVISQRLANLKQRAEDLQKEYEFEKRIEERQKRIFQKHGKSVKSHQLNAVDVHLGLSDLKKPLINPERFYSATLQELKNFLDGIIDAPTFEDSLRNMFGTSAYIMFTMDKLITTITRQMQILVTDETSIKAMNLFQNYCLHRARNTNHSISYFDEQYENVAEKIITNQNCYKMVFIYSERPKLAIELLNTDNKQNSEDDSGDDNTINLTDWNNYVEKYAGDADDDEEFDLPLEEPFLFRNVINRKMAAENLLDPFSPSSSYSTPFYVNDGLRAILSTKNSRLLYERGTSDVLIKKGSFTIAKQTHRELFERRRQRFNLLLSNFYKKNEAKTKNNESNLQKNTDLSFSWFSNNCRSILYRHRDFEYITYTRYFTLHENQTNNTITKPPLSISIATTTSNLTSEISQKFNMF